MNRLLPGLGGRMHLPAHSASRDSYEQMKSHRSAEKQQWAGCRRLDVTAPLTQDEKVKINSCWSWGERALLTIHVPSTYFLFYFIRCSVARSY